MPKPKYEEKKPEPKPEPKKEEKPAETKPEIPLTAQQKEALEEKDKGNEAYKKKDFDTAIAHYKKAMELDPDNMTYQTNLAGLFLKTKVHLTSFFFSYW